MSASETADAQPVEHGLKHYPIPLFAVTMGLFGFTLASFAFAHAHGFAPLIGNIALSVSALILAVVSLFYIAKLVKYPDAVKGEWNHPVRIAFFPAISIAYLLLATAMVRAQVPGAGAVWIAGTVAQGIFAVSVIASWISHRPYQPMHISPAWFIPAVGNVIVPIAGVPLGFIDISWLFFSAGMLFWVVLLTLVMNRLMFHDPLPQRLIPTMVILIAPPAVAYVSWLRLTGEPGAMGNMLLSLAYVFAVIVLTQANKIRAVPFALSWWALSFPVAALSIASFAHADATGSAIHRLIGDGVYAVLGVIIVLLMVRTLKAFAQRKICVPE